MMLSEVAKGRAQIEDMWSYAQSAVKTLQDDEENTPQNLLLTFKMNLARLDLYFNNNAAAACNEFERLLTEIANPSDAGVAETYAALKRNLAEGLFEFEAYGQAKDVKAARRHLDEGIEAAKHFGLHALASECAYSLAKLEESAGSPDIAISALDRCAELAIEAKHPLVHRIARLRQYRVRVQYQGHAFDDAAFRGLIRPLDAMIDHAWAARYSAQSRIWAARQTYETGEYDLPSGYLREVISIAQDVPGLSTAADLPMLITANAGLRAIAEKTGSGFDWEGFAARSHVAEWLAAKKINPEQLWRRVFRMGSASLGGGRVASWWQWWQWWRRRWRRWRWRWRRPQGYGFHFSAFQVPHRTDQQPQQHARRRSCTRLRSSRL
ncbi:hypothetical protein T190_05575 [Sinorhizobium meliloti CCBAU 01290]|nr:hypothetical protein T190_05575 [Sinorhizobium meliloti CCBAU 01290]